MEYNMSHHIEKGFVKYPDVFFWSGGIIFNTHFKYFNYNFKVFKFKSISKRMDAQMGFFGS